MIAFLTLNVQCKDTAARADLLELLAKNGYEYQAPGTPDPDKREAEDSLWEEPKNKILRMSIDAPETKGKTDVPDEHLAAHYAILLKSARRCAYDLRHAADDLRSDEMGYGDRANRWLQIFAPGGVKNYRLELHQEIFRLECQIRELQRLCEKHGIDHRATSWIGT